VLCTKTRDESLTTIFRNPALAANSDNFTIICAAKLGSSSAGNCGVMQKAILVEKELDYQTVICITLLSIVLSILVGLLAGMLSKRLDIAIAFSGGIFTVIQIVEALLLRYLRQ
jgi:hypothetical protein